MVPLIAGEPYSGSRQWTGKAFCRFRLRRLGKRSSTVSIGTAMDRMARSTTPSRYSSTRPRRARRSSRISRIRKRRRIRIRKSLQRPKDCSAPRHRRIDDRPELDRGRRKLTSATSPQKVSLQNDFLSAPLFVIAHKFSASRAAARKLAAAYLLSVLWLIIRLERVYSAVIQTEFLSLAAETAVPEPDYERSGTWTIRQLTLRTPRSQRQYQTRAGVLDGVHALATVGDAAAILALTTTRRPEGQSFYQ